MRFGFLNNFAAQIAAPLNDTATELELSEGAELLEAALSSADAVALTLFATDSQGNETKREVVYATAVAAGVVTVERGQEGTEAQAFTPGDVAEARLTAGMLNGIQEDAASALSDYDGVISSTTAIATGVDAIAIGSSAEATGEDAIAIGSYIEHTGEMGITIGAGSSTNPEEGSTYTASVVLGAYSHSRGDENIVIGAYSAAGEGGVFGDGSIRAGICIGAYAVAEANNSIAIGESASAGAFASLALGTSARSEADSAIAIGAAANATIPGGLQVNALPYLPASYNTASGTVAEATTTQSSSQVIIATTSIDVKSASATAELFLPTNAILIPDAFDVVVVEASGAGGAPEIQIGPDDVTPDAYLAATPVTKTAVGGRETHTPLVADGITALRVAVTTAGTGTAYKIKVVVRGYVMEV